MGQYTPSYPSGDSGITKTYIQGELGSIASAHNTHETGDFPADCVPNSALVSNKAKHWDKLFREYLGAGIAIGTHQMDLPIPTSMTLKKVKAYSTSIGTGGSHQVDVYHNSGVSVLNSPITIAAAGTVYSGSISGGSYSLSENDYLSLRVVTPASTGFLTNIVVVVYFEDVHIS